MTTTPLPSPRTGIRCSASIGAQIGASSPDEQKFLGCCKLATARCRSCALTRVAAGRSLPSPVTGLPRLPEPPFRRAVPTTPADQAGARVDCFPAHAAFPKWQEGIRIVTFEACSGFTHVTARRIAQPPTAAFVTRLQPFRLPSRAARQLPDQSTTLWVDSPSTGDPRLRGALPKTDFRPLAITGDLQGTFRPRL